MRRRGRLFSGLGILALSLAAVAATGCKDQEVGELPIVETGAIRSFEIASRRHVDERVSYNQLPPVGGDHSSAWQPCGFYSRWISPERGVHSMEHGAVWITYHPRLPRADVNRLRQLAQEQSHVLVSRWHPDLPAPIVASAWGRQVRIRTAADPQLGEFVRMFVRGPQAPEQGVRC